MWKGRVGSALSHIRKQNTAGNLPAFAKTDHLSWLTSEQSREKRDLQSGCISSVQKTGIRLKLGIQLTHVRYVWQYQSRTSLRLRALSERWIIQSYFCSSSNVSTQSLEVRRHFDLAVNCHKENKIPVYSVVLMVFGWKDTGLDMESLVEIGLGE